MNRQRNGRGRVYEGQIGSRHIGGASPIVQLMNAIKALAAPDVMLVSEKGVLNQSDAPAVNGEFVKTWQDQSGNNRHAVAANQPNQCGFLFDAGNTGLTPNFPLLANTFGGVAYYEGSFPFIGSNITLITVGFEFSGGAWVMSTVGTSGVADTGANAMRCLENTTPGGSTVRARHNLSSTATQVEGGVKRSLYTTQLGGGNLICSIDGNVQSVADAGSLNTSIYGIFNDPTKVASNTGILFPMYFHAIWSSFLTGGTLSGIQTLLKNYYNTT